VITPALLFFAAVASLPEAVEKQDVAAVEKLLRDGADVRAANRYGVTPLSLACVSGNGRLVELLLRAGADANAALPGGETALMTASRTGKPGAVKALLAAGAQVNARESFRGQTALMWAAAEGHREVVETLLAAGADWRLSLDSGYTAFFFAVREGRGAVVKALLAAGQDVNETMKLKPGFARKGNMPREGTSALHLAVASAHFELAGELLDAGANPNADGSGLTVLHSITGVRKPGLGDNDPAPYGSGSMSSLDLVRKLKAKGANLDARMTRRINIGLTSLNTMGATPFFLAARSADAELMKLLAELGANPLLGNVDGSTPLHAAAGLGTRSPGEDAGTEAEVVEAVKVALDLGNEIDAVDKNGETAMHAAAYKNVPAAVTYLAERGAKIAVWNRVNRGGWTPLRIAEGYRYGNFKPSPETVAAFRRVFDQAGVKPAESTAREKSVY
jgi:uncharacterized protein